MTKTYISFSTVPPRISKIEPILDSLVNQSVKPDKIFINVPRKYDRFDNELIIPDFIETKFKDIVEIFYLEKDYGPATKFIGSFLNDQIKEDDFIVITDDDVLKVKDWLDTLIQFHQDKRITGFVERNLGKEIIWGYLGYIFKKKLINKNELCTFYESVKSECNLVDDHWFTGFCHFKKIPIYNIPIFTSNSVNENGLPTEVDALVKGKGDNSRKIVSQKCRDLILKDYKTDFPFWCCIGCCHKGKRIESFKNIPKSSSIKTYVIILIILLIISNAKFLLKNKILLLPILLSPICYIFIKKNKNCEGFSKKIPKVLVQTYHKKNLIPKKVYENVKKFAPNYKHKIYNDKECINFIKNNFNENIVNLFKKLKGAHKADLFRYCYLYINGGVYLDIKTELIKPLDKIFVGNYTYSVISTVRNSIFQGILASPPKNPIFLRLIYFMLNLINTGRPYHYLIFTKDFWSKIKEDCLDDPKLGFNKNLNNEGYNYFLYEEKCSTKKNKCYDGLDRWGLCCFIKDKSKKIIKNRYSDYPWH